MNGAKKLACVVVACAVAMTAGAADVTVDFSRKTGEINPRLHSSGCAPRLYPRAIRNADGTLNKCWYSMKLFGDFVKAAKTKVAVEVDAKKVKTIAAVAGLSEDGKTASIVVVDYRGKGDKLFVDVKGLGGVMSASALVLDYTRDLTPVPVDFRNGTICLPRNNENSAAYLVTLEL